jgi:hypothetical protein
MLPFSLVWKMEGPFFLAFLSRLEDGMAFIFLHA